MAVLSKGNFPGMGLNGDGCIKVPGSHIISLKLVKIGLKLLLLTSKM